MHFASTVTYSAGVSLGSANPAAQSVWLGTHPIAPGTPGQVGCGACIAPGMDCGAAALYYGINPLSKSASVSFGSAPKDVQTSWLSNPQTCTRTNICKSLKAAYDIVPYQSWGAADSRPVLQAWWNANDCNHA